jgi:hypothetical protein
LIGNVNTCRSQIDATRQQFNMGNKRRPRIKTGKSRMNLICGMYSGNSGAEMKRANGSAAARMEFQAR